MAEAMQCGSTEGRLVMEFLHRGTADLDTGGYRALAYLPRAGGHRCQDPALAGNGLTLIVLGLPRRQGEPPGTNLPLQGII